MEDQATALAFEVAKFQLGHMADVQPQLALGGPEPKAVARGRRPVAIVQRGPLD